MAYTATSWVNGSEPAINAANLNKLEAGVVAAHEAAAAPTAWGDVSGKPSTFPPTVGTSASTAKAGDWKPTISDVTGLEAKISDLEARIAALEPSGE